MQEHEYSIIGHDRAQIGRYLGVGAGMIVSAIGVMIITGFGWAQKGGLIESIPPVILLPVAGTTFYSLGHWVFNKFAWRFRLILMFMSIPDLNGEWDCRGETLNLDGETVYDWTGVVTISQTWQKICIRLKTQQSGSYSVSTAVIKDPAGGFRLMYSYRNEPRAGESELRPHRGCCELDITEDGLSAAGDYFNNNGRVTFGRMRLNKRS